MIPMNDIVLAMDFLDGYYSIPLNDAHLNIVLDNFLHLIVNHRVPAILND